MTDSIRSIAEMLKSLERDVWRDPTRFSSDIEAAHQVLLDARAKESKVRDTLMLWLQKYQPCLFGRLAARENMLSLCILRDEDLATPDDAIAAHIQRARLQWMRDGFDGRKHGFVIAVLSERIAFAAPNANLLKLALKLCSLYLQRNVLPDQIYLDELFLEKPGSYGVIWRWFVGVNYFGAQGDLRWWHDHRFPGGMAFSMNSVGHMMKAGRIGGAMEALNRELGVADGEWAAGKWQDLGKGLQVAMQTIHGATSTPSGKATRLVPIEEVAPSHACPISLPSHLSRMNHCEYRGYYHTDVTVPSSYFDGAVDRPESIPEIQLDFTYLFKEGSDNPDFDTMGRGLQIRAEGESRGEARDWRTRPAELSIDDCPRLRDALRL